MIAPLREPGRFRGLLPQLHHLGEAVIVRCQLGAIGVHDLWLDASPSGYPKKGRPDRPGFRPGPLTLCAWIAALVWDALCALSDALPARFHLAHPRTLRRWVLVRDADLILTSSHLLVVLDFDRRRPWLRPLLQQFNKAEVALPWLEERHVVMGFAARSQRLSDAQPVLPKRAEAGYGFAEGCGRLDICRCFTIADITPPIGAKPWQGATVDGSESVRWARAKWATKLEAAVCVAVEATTSIGRGV